MSNCNNKALELLAIRNGSTSLDLALDMYEMFFNAIQAVSLGKQYTINDGQNSQRIMRREDLDLLQSELKYWESQVNLLSGCNDPYAPKVRTLFTRKHRIVGC